MNLVFLWLQLAGAAAVILLASTFLARSADVIAYRTGLGRTFIGIVLLATATSLPELATGISAVTLVGVPDLAAGDAFGSNLFNLLIIGLLDIFWREGPILRSVPNTAVLTSALGILAISLGALAILVHGSTSMLSTWPVSPFSLAMLAVLLAGLYMIFRAENSGSSTKPLNDPRHGQEYESYGMGRAVLTYLIAATVVVVAAVYLAGIGDEVARTMGWEASYVGTQFLAFSTSLPELAASFAAIRLRAPELAISNVLGSNLFNMGFVLFLDDVAYTQGALWAAVSTIHVLTAAIAVIMTSVVILALTSRSNVTHARTGMIEAGLLIGAYVVASFLVFTLG